MDNVYDSHAAPDLATYAAGPNDAEAITQELHTATTSAEVKPQATPAWEAPASDRMRFRMMAFGGQLTLMMVGKHTTPEALANTLSVEPHVLRELMCGESAEVSLATLDRIASHLGGAFVFGWMPPGQQQAA